MHSKSLRLGVAAAIVAAGLVSFATPGASSPQRHERASEYPLQVIAVQTDPRRPKAGKRFTVLIGIVNQETGDVVQSGNVACPARIGSHGIRVKDKAFVDGVGIA